MYKKIIFWGFLFFNISVFAQADIEFKPIVVTKKHFYLLKDYTVDTELLKINSADGLLNSAKYSPLELTSRSSFADIQHDFSLRASNFEGVVVLLNERKINDPQTGHHNSDIPLTVLDIERIEIFPAGGSSLFGPATIAGAINIVSKEEFDKKNTIEISTASNALKSILFGLSDINFGNLCMKFSSEVKESDGFYYDTDFKKYTFNIDSRGDLNFAKFAMFLGYQEKEFGAYDFYTPFKGYPSKEWTKTYLINTDFDFYIIEDLSLRQNFLWRRHYDKFLLDKTLLRSKYLNHHQTDTFSPLIYLKGKDFLNGQFGLGFEYNQDRIVSTNLGLHQRNYQGIFLEERNDLDSFSYGISYRSDYINKDILSSGLLNIRFPLAENKRLSSGLSRSIRMPSFTELYYNDPVTEGNPELKPENAYKYELDYEYDDKEKELFYFLSIFFRKEEDFIDWVKQDPAQLKWKAKNITSAKVRGVELGCKRKLKSFLNLDLFYTYVDRKIETKQYNYKYGLNYTRHKFFCNFDFLYKRCRYFLGISYYKKPHRDGWLLSDLNFIYKTPKENMEIFFKISNLFNTEYQEIEGIPSPKRVLNLGLRLRW